jgi:hypothetical protein
MACTCSSVETRSRQSSINANFVYASCSARLNLARDLVAQLNLVQA